MIPIENFLLLSAILFAIGFFGVLARRSAILILMSVELMLAAVGINFIAFAAYLDPERFSGLIFALFIIAIAAAEVGLALPGAAGGALQRAVTHRGGMTG